MVDMWIDSASGVAPVCRQSTENVGIKGSRAGRVVYLFAVGSGAWSPGRLPRTNQKKRAGWSQGQKGQDRLEFNEKNYGLSRRVRPVIIHMCSWSGVVACKRKGWIYKQYLISEVPGFWAKPPSCQVLNVIPGVERRHFRAEGISAFNFLITCVHSVPRLRASASPFTKFRRRICAARKL